jgi:hypothetical protein
MTTPFLNYIPPPRDAKWFEKCPDPKWSKVTTESLQGGDGRKGLIKALVAGN